MSVAHLYTVHISSASPRGPGTDAHLGGSLRIHGRPGARVPALGGGQVLRAALPLRSTGGPSVTAALSVCVNQRGGCSPLPAADFPFV